MFNGLRVAALLAASTLWANESTYDRPYAEREAVQAYIAELVAEHGFEADALNALFAQAELRTDIIERISKPAEKVWTWGRYKNLLVDDARIQAGAEFWREHADAFAMAEADYGVAPEYIVAILGIETRYGEFRGAWRVLDALMTLGFDYPPRAAFFKKELTQFLLLAREEGKDPATLMGSYAGAMGYGQFIPSSYRSYAIDFDGDGVRDIWENVDDAIGSIANYFVRHKWRGEGPVALALDDPEDKLRSIANQGLKLRHTVADVRALGIAVPAEVANEARVAAYVLEGNEGDERWLGFHDFYAITRYNHSHLYALAVEHLARGIRVTHGQLELAAAGSTP